MKLVLKSLLVELSSKLPFRKPLYFFKKKIYRYISIGRISKQPVRDLVLKGAINYKGVIENEVLDKWIDVYGLDESNIIQADGNIAFPFFNKDVLKLIVDSQFSEVLFEYFKTIHGCKPVLQSIPYLVISYPNISHDNFDPMKNNFPANWHTDYISEFTAHIPLSEINSSLTHTIYAMDTHTSPYKASPEMAKTKKIFKSYCNRGDVVMLDVDGWHHGRLEAAAPRIMIQFKFTKGNDTLLYPKDGLSLKAKLQIERTKNHIQSYKVIEKQLKRDLEFTRNMSYTHPILNILKDNHQYYDDYIS